MVFETDCYSGSKGHCNHANVYNSYLCSSNVIVTAVILMVNLIATAEIGVAYGVLLDGLAIWLHKL